MKKYRASQSAYSKKRRDENREWARQLLGGECVECGSTGRLEFDHIYPSTMEFRIGTYIGWSREKLLPELIKCQLLCRRCHQAKTAVETARFYAPVKHGLASTYSNKRCRCDSCRKAWREYYSLKRYRKKVAIVVD